MKLRLLALPAVVASALLCVAGAAQARPDATPHAATGTPSGVLTVAQPAGAAHATITAYDPATGKVTGTYATPWSIGTTARNITVSPDRQYAAATVDRSLRLAVLDGNGYTEVHRWTGADMPNGNVFSLQTPRFLPDDRLMVAALDDNGALSSSWAVDAKNPGAAAKRQPVTDNLWDTKGRHAVWQRNQPLTDQPYINGQSVSVDMLRTSASLVAARIRSFDGSFVPYRCDEQIDDTRLLCVADLRLARLRGYSLPQGAVAVLSLEAPEIGGGVLTKAIGTLPDHAQPGEREEIQDVFQSPDHTGLLIATDRGWYTGPADGSTAPQYAFEHLGGTPATPENSVVLGWAPAHVIEP